MDAFITTGHPLGGTFYWYRLGDRVFSVLGDGYPHHTDYELHERFPQDNDDVASWPVEPVTERRFATLTAATDWIASEATL